jgi:hypothetical protein
VQAGCDAEFDWRPSCGDAQCWTRIFAVAN